MFLTNGYLPNIINFDTVFEKTSEKEIRIKGAVLEGSHYTSLSSKCLFIAYGDVFKKGEELDGGSLYDTTPTVLHMFDLPIPEDMDGKVLKEIFKEDSEPVQREIRYQKVGEKEKVKDIIGKIKKLVNYNLETEFFIRFFNSKVSHQN